MNSLTNEFALHLGINIQIEDNFDFTTDYSNFNSIDGEEGDNGIILYYHNNNLICQKNVYGGDNEDYEFTSYGVNLLTDYIFKEINNRITKYKPLVYSS